MKQLPDDAPPKNAKTEVWADYAEDQGVVVTEDMGRDEIQAAVLAAQPDFQPPPTGEPAENFTEEGPALERKSAPYFDI